MDEVRVVRRRTHIWPIVIAIIVLAIVIAWAFFAMDAAQTELGARPVMEMQRTANGSIVIASWLRLAAA